MRNVRYSTVEEPVSNNSDQHEDEYVSTDIKHSAVATPVPSDSATVSTVGGQPAAPALVEHTFKQSDPITLVLQWLTYAFWGWFALAMLWLSFVTFMFFTDSTSQDDWSSVVAYPIAAVVVLFLMASSTDLFYSRREPVHKTGIATAIMVIHTVLFALCGVGLVVGIVFTLIQMMLETGSKEMLQTALYTGLVGVVVYLLLIARTTMLAKFKRLPKLTMAALGSIAIVFVVLCIVGPFARSLETKQDRQIESVLPSIDTSIRAYVRENDKLPDSLDALKVKNTDSYSYSSRSSATFKSDVDELLSKKAIEYTANTKPASKRVTGYTTDNRYLQKDPQDGYRHTTFYYQLCVTYKAQKGSDGAIRGNYYESDDLMNGANAASEDDGASSSSGASYNSDYISTYSHKKGRQCYDLQTANSESLRGTIVN